MGSRLTGAEVRPTRRCSEGERLGDVRGFPPVSADFASHSCAGGCIGSGAVADCETRQQISPANPESLR